jgi:hypothetical protein
MKFIIQFITILIGAYILELFLPWYCIAISAFLGGYILKSNANFFAGFLAIGLLWLLKAMLIDATSTSILADRVALIFPVKQKALLYVVMVLLGGLVGGFAALAGSALKQERKKYY